ncbi:kinase-like domain-containing protein [Boeremia exigua]|uniref:kinase-like domain-containing protein n=1 Tax=Boeremia exigua TaxID=749465 RepID=UPI001E8E259F|nr:kinase-like domain-containing protein [Boeremia exigua]KAH6620574.1 kinase-like domain-containing protein [Boeremia exigua]
MAPATPSVAESGEQKLPPEVLSDWSGTGRGSHIEFDYNETVPLEPAGEYLGGGATGDVYETKICGCSVAWKRVHSKRKITSEDKKGIEILKKLSHIHLIQLGCLVSAIAYLHAQKIRHQDLKPSNILLSREKLYLSDFGSAKDFSRASRTATNSDHGTPHYFAPEVAAREPSGRAADMFSLGCIMLEILVLQHEGSLERLRVNASPKDSAFHANLENIDAWLSFRGIDDMSVLDKHLVKVIRSLLSKAPEVRPSADRLLSGIRLCSMVENPSISVLGVCCRESHDPTTSFSKAPREEAAQSLSEDLGKTIEKPRSTAALPIRIGASEKAKVNHNYLGTQWEQCADVREQPLEQKKVSLEAGKSEVGPSLRVVKR